MEYFTDKLSNGNEIKYKRLDSGTCYHADTPQAVVNVLECAREGRYRLRVWLGDKSGKSWNEENETTGYIGRSTGQIKIPLLVNNRRSYGGVALLDDCIVKIVDIKTGRTLYQHANFQQAIFTVDGQAVLQDGKAFAPLCGTPEKAQRLADYMNGKRNGK